MSSSPPAVPGMLSMSPTAPSVFGTSVGSATSLTAPDKEPKKEKGLYPSRVVLTSELARTGNSKLTAAYPGQAGVSPYPIQWGAGRESPPRLFV